METAPKFRKRKKNSSLCIYILHKTSHQEISSPRLAVTAMKCTKKCNARAKFVVLVIKPIAFWLKLPNELDGTGRIVGGKFL